jgi:anti-sigma factor RsiW
MNCSEVRALLDGHLDGELDLVRTVAIEDHLRTCDACSQIDQAQRQLRSALRSEELYFRAPAHLERQVRTAARRAGRVLWLPRPAPAGWLGIAAAAAAVAVLAVLVGPLLWRPSPREQIAQDVVAAHIRSLMPGHLTDVPSSEQHTVKPWFAGKLAFSPPVADLSGEGFPLVGGRLDFAAGRPVAALVYRRGGHLINLFVWPSASTRDSAESADARLGYNLLSWAGNQTNFWAVSDLNATELRQFTRLVRDRLAGITRSDTPSPAP